MRYIGGVYANQRPTEFLCLLLKLLQIQPEKEILIEYLRADEFKSVFPIPDIGWAKEADVGICARSRQCISA